MKNINYGALFLGLFFVFDIILLGGCSSAESINNSNVTQVLLEKKKQTLVDSTFKSKKILALESISESLIGSISRVFSIDDKLYIFDKSRQRLFAFNDKGKFVRVYYHIGKGPGEYSQVMDVCFDASSKQLIFLCSAPYKLIYYNIEGQFMGEKALDKLFVEIKADRDYIYLLRSNSSNNIPNEYAIYTIDKKTMELEEKLLAIKELSTTMIKGNTMIESDKILFTRRFDNQIYQLNNGEVKALYKLDFGCNNLPGNLKNNQYSRNEFSDLCQGKKYIYSLTNAFDTKDKLFFSTNLPATYSISKKTKTITEHDALMDTEYGIGASFYFPIERTTSKIGLVFNAATIKRYQEYLPEINKHKDAEINNKRLGLAESLSNDSNPVLFIYELK